MIKKGFVILFSSLFSVFLGYGIIYAWVGLTASPGDQLTSSKWNELVDKVANVYSTGANIGIGTTTPGYNLEVSGSTSLASTNGTVYIGTQNNENEGAEIRLKGAGTNDSWVQDVYAQGLRFYTNTANTNTVSIFNNSTGVANLSVEGTATAATPTASNHLATKAYVDAAVSAAGGGGKSKSETFTSGAGTWTVPTGVTGVEVILVGAGGGGGGCSNSSTTSGTNGTNGGNTTFGSLTAYGGAGGGGGSTYYTSSSGAGGKGGGNLGAWGAGDSSSGCDGVDTTPSKFSATIFGGGGGGGECAGGGIGLFSGHSTGHRGGGSYSSIYGAGGNRGGNCGGGGGGGEVVRLTIPVSGTVSYSIGSSGIAGTGNVGNGTNGYGGYIQINYVE